MPPFRIGDVTISGRVLTAPMTGVSDLPFRRAASRLGAAYVATEMVACDSFARGRPDVVRRAKPHVFLVINQFDSSKF